MTIEQWLTVAMVIAVIITAVATALGPIAAVLIQLRMSQPKPTPVVNQPKNLTQRTGSWLSRFLTSTLPYRIMRLLCVLSLLISIYLLNFHLHRTEPITRQSVFSIALGVGLVVYNTLAIGIFTAFKALKELDDTSKESAMIDRELLEIDEATLDIVKLLSEKVDTIIEAKNAPRLQQPALDKTSQGLLGKLQAKVKELLGE